jgi:raffinose/stachyose/melibiose transport system permease protein
MTGRARKKNGQALLFLAPALALLLFVYAGPLLFAMAVSLTDWTGIGWNMNFVGLSNYRAMFTESYMGLVLTNNLKFLLGTLLLQNLFALGLALLLGRHFRGCSAFRAIFFLPTVITTVAVGVIFSIILDPINGPVAAFSKSVGWQGLQRFRFLADPKAVMYTIILVNVWQWTGYNMVIYIAGLQAIPQDIYEAGDIDGASGFARLRYITLPMLAPAITINVVMTTMGGLKVFDLPFVMTGGGPGYYSETLAMTIIRNSFSLDKVGLGSAMSLVLAAATLAVTLLQNHFLSKGEEAVKT